MIDILSSIGMGAITGLFGPIITGITNYKMQKLKGQQEVDKIKAESDAMVKEAEANIKITEAKVSGEIAVAEMEAYKLSQEIGNKDLFKESYMEKLASIKYIGWILAGILAFAMGQVDVFKASIRPALTVYLIGMSTYLTYDCYKILETVGIEKMSADWAMNMYQSVVLTLIYLTVTCVGWWFCDRRVGKFLENHLK